MPHHCHGAFQLVDISCLSKNLMIYINLSDSGRSDEVFHREVWQWLQADGNAKHKKRETGRTDTLPTIHGPRAEIKHRALFSLPAMFK